MSATATKENGKQLQPADRTISFVPLGERTAIELSIGMVRKFLAVRTKSGKEPTDQDIVKFMMLCKARELNPWVGDAYLVGYDGNDGPAFSLITAQQALAKRAEISPAYDGMESGVVVTTCDHTLEYREGDLVLEGETLIGGWAKCYRKDRAKPSYDAVKFSTFNTGRSRWQKDPAGMIVKVAEASVLRKAFPTQIGGLYTEEEMQHLAHQRIEGRQAVVQSKAQIESILAATHQPVTEETDDQPHEPPQETREVDHDADPIEIELNGAMGHVKTIPDKIGVNKFEAETEPRLRASGVSEEGLKEFHAACDWRRKEIGGTRGPKGQQNLMETAPMA